MWVYFFRIPIEERHPSMPTIEELITILLPILPDAEVGQDNDGQIVIYTGLTTPDEPA